MSEIPLVAVLSVALHLLIQGGVIVRVLLRPHREPASRIAWVVVVIALPVLGILAYILFGEVNIGRRRAERMREVLRRMPDVAAAAGVNAKTLQADVPQRYAHLFRVGHSISRFEPVGGNSGGLLPDSKRLSTILCKRSVTLVSWHAFFESIAKRFSASFPSFTGTVHF